MLTYREYKVLKQLKKFQNEKSKNANYQHKIDILNQDFYDKIKYKLSTLNTILQSLAENGYIEDVFNMMETTVHTVKITDKGYDALNNFFKNSAFKLGKIIFTSAITLIIEHIFDIISFFKKLFLLIYDL